MYCKNYSQIIFWQKLYIQDISPSLNSTCPPNLVQFCETIIKDMQLVPFIYFSLACLLLVDLFALMLTLWLQQADKSTHRTGQLATGGLQISPHDSTVLQIVDKSAELIKNTRHEWPMKRPQDYQPSKDEKLCLSILLVHTYIQKLRF